MTAYIITIGDEILIGQIINTNAAFIAQKLGEIGIQVTKSISVGDNKKAIDDVLNEAKDNANLVLITGGLGPTSDDITKPALFEFFDSKPVFNEAVYKQVEIFLSKVKGSMNELNRSQAIVGSNCDVITNTCGTAPGMWFEKDGVVFVAMPGVPFEMQLMMDKILIPRFINHFKCPTIIHRHVMLTGIAESALAIKLETWEKHLPESVRLAYLPSPGIVKLRLSCYDSGINDVESQLKLEVDKLSTIVKEYIYSYKEQTIEETVFELLLNNKKTIALAESCTGGNIAHLITSIPGSSMVFKGGIVAYSNEIKMQELSVPESTLIKNGAVSQQVVEVMAQNIRLKFKSDYSIAVSGIAGPDGGTVDKPVGTVWIAVSSADKTISKLFNTGDHRGRSITRSSIYALNMIRQIIVE